MELRLKHQRVEEVGAAGEGGGVACPVGEATEQLRLELIGGRHQDVGAEGDGGAEGGELCCRRLVLGGRRRQLVVAQEFVEAQGA